MNFITNKHLARVTTYKQRKDTLDFKDMKFPVTIKDITKFEKMNDIKVNVFRYKQYVYPLRLSEKFENAINLQLFSEGENKHYCWIKNFNKLVSS